MTSTRPPLTFAALAAALALAGCQSAMQSPAVNTLVAQPVDSAPALDAVNLDPRWASMPALNIKLVDGANFGAKPGEKADTKGLMKAMYTGDTLYLLLQYVDPTVSIRRGPYQKQADGRWVKLKDPADKGGDDNVYYEDKWAVIWNIGNSIKGFDKHGCDAMCHLDQGKPFGNKYTAAPGELGDMWHMKSMRTAPWGYVDDQYVDHTRYDVKASPNAGRKSDAGMPGGEYNGFPLVDGKPQFMAHSGKPGNGGGYYYIKRGDEVAFNDALFKPGDEVASYIVNPPQGDRGDVRLALSWREGVYTSVVSRKLVTGSPTDIQFSDLGARYGFGVAAFDNAQVRHATTEDPLYLAFGRK